MCTAISFQTKDHYFGRTLDVDHMYHEAVVIMPRNYELRFRNGNVLSSHYAMIGMATVSDEYPLYYDATNEYGLSMAGLNFPGNAVYLPVRQNADNISPFELIAWILCQCRSVQHAQQLLRTINIAEIPFSDAYALTPLHWIISDRTGSIVVEPRADGLHVFDNPIGILTNSPPFDFHIYNLSNYLNLTADEPENRFSNKVQLNPASHGMGAFGLPGDLSSASRFVKAAFVKLNSVCGSTENESVSQFFHVLNSVAQQRGCVCTKSGYVITVYTSCCNADTGVYYYTTYENSQITAVNMHSVDLQNTQLYVYALVKEQQINRIN